MMKSIAWTSIWINFAMRPATAFLRFGGAGLHRPTRHESAMLLLASSSSSLAALAASSSKSFSASPSRITQIMQEESEAEVLKLKEFYDSMRGDSATKAPLVLTKKARVVDFVKNEIDSVLFDCDGVLYRSPDPAPGAQECIQNLIAQGKRIYFVTNNAASNRKQLKEKLSSILKLDCLSEEMMVGSAFSTAQYLKQSILDKKGSGRLFVIGSTGLCDELRQIGFHVIEGADKPSMTRDELADYEFDEKPIDAVVVGHDIDLNFRKLCIANVLLQRNPDAELVATNLDAFDLVGGDGRHIPGNGGSVKFLEHTSGRTAVNCGKPSKLLAELLDSLYGLDTSRALFVGDRLDTDIRFGVDTGMHSALVLTGVTTSQQMKTLGGGSSEGPLPSMIIPHVGFLA